MSNESSNESQVANQSPLAQGTVVIHGQYVKDFSFENPNAPECFSKQGQPNINISIDVLTDELDKDIFEVVISTSITSKIEEDTLFVIDLKYAGVFEVKGSDDIIPELLLVKCPEILFPFVRRIIFTSTSEGGFAPLTLQPLDFLSLYIQKLQSDGTAEKGTV